MIKSMLTLESPANEIKGIGPTASQRLKRVGIQKISDLLLYLPFRYEDLAKVEKIALRIER